MPVRSLNSSVMKWPDKKGVEKSLKKCIRDLLEGRSDILKVGYFGSYARDDWGVGSDLDLIIILKQTSKSFERRGIDFDTGDIAVPVDLLVYSRKEWSDMEEKESVFYCTLNEEIEWVFNSEGNLQI